VPSDRPALPDRSRGAVTAQGGGGPSPVRPGLMAGAPPFGPHSQVTLANWQDPPFNRWAFQHVRELIPTARIRCGDGPGWRLATEERDIAGLSFRSEDRELSIAELLAETYTDGFLVLHRSRIVTEQYFNGLAPDVPHLLMSVSKSVTSTVAGVLVGRGLLDASALVTGIVPELHGTSFEGATVQHLLDMRAGTRFDEDYDNPEADVRSYERVYLWRPDDGRARPEDALGYFATLQNDGPHGGPFRYRSVLTDVLAWVLERAAGTRLHELIATQLWQPMGAEFDAEITVDSRGNPMADGGICVTLRDLARFGQLFLQQGRAGSQQIVPAAWIDDTIRGAPDGPAAFRAGDNPDGYPPGAHYRNCWWVRDPGLPFYDASGINGQHVFIHVPSQTVVVKLSTWPAAWREDCSQLTVRGVTAITAALWG
jgi:CubicO group peptidase (beta-lactamase class C family)